jgi:hypothetical protein
MRYYFILGKVFLFVICVGLFLPLTPFIGRVEYVTAVHRVLQGYIDELFDSGCINEDERKELENDLNS